MARFLVALRSGWGIADRVERMQEGALNFVLSQALDSYKLCRYQLKLVNVFGTAVACTPRPGLEHQSQRHLVLILLYLAGSFRWYHTQGCVG
jgi:hypothetical protein